MFKLLCMLFSIIKKKHEVSTWLHKQRWSSTRENIPVGTFEVTIYETLDKRRKNGVLFSSKNRRSWILRLQKLGIE